jgi:hypothetical protein
MFPCNCECCKKHLETINELQKILFSKFTPTIVETKMSDTMREAILKKERDEKQKLMDFLELKGK